MAGRQKLTATQLAGLVALLLGTLVICNDFTALNVVIPSIETAFKVDVTTAQWVISGYALVFGVCIVTAGRLADMFGRRRIFFIGMTIFCSFSLIGGLAENAWVLLGARALMGIGGSMIWPSLIGMMYGLLPEERAALAGGLLMGVAGIGNGMGPMLGGFFADYLSWRWIFFINVPVGIIAVLAIFWAVPKDGDDDTKEGIDYPGILALSLGLFLLMLLLDISADFGWLSPMVISMFAVSIFLLSLFAFIEKRAGLDALVPEDVFSNKDFRFSNISVLLVSAIYFGTLLYLPQFMVKDLGFSALQAGAGLLPMLGMFALSSFVAAPLYDRLGPKLVISIGVLCLGVGVFILSWLQAGTTFASLVPGMLIVGIGTGLFYSSITTAAITSIDPARSSLASAIIFMVQNAGGAVGLGLTTAIVVSAPSLADGIDRAFFVNAIMALVALVVSLLYVAGPLTRDNLLPWRKENAEELAE
ncbi:DHA2 family efflux MFS transporter permease subunit [Sneathiella chungangensis]|uniref:DHA2 family efflux MFS transporter permease subunit n=1 Tax=Sneathiella chungangensis TaxID=1418234 RepID=A0A845MHZ2_9PROT|nr:MFS transporter [Sneathiella chungangensis]MZR23429.1 DHA2 family efflux MFS transporter permease subunit [Sneathiella chungangensis]